MASKNTASTLAESWVVSGLDESAVLVDNNETTPAASFSENLTPISSYSESELIGDYDDTPASESLPNLADSTSSLTSVASASASTSPGPELIMPSIMFESRASEHGSWVIPRKRSKQSLYESRKAPRLPKPSRKDASAHEQENRHPQPQKDSEPAPAAPAPVPAGRGVRAYYAQIRNYFAVDLQHYEFFRLILNFLLVLMVMHLLVFPEVVHQLPVTCRIPAVSTVYSQTCASLNKDSTGIPSFTANFQSAVRTQSQLQIYLNQTIDEMSPVDSSLKDSDTTLRGIYSEIRKEYGSARHEIELEFEGVWAASRTITRALTNLKMDIKATVDGFQMPTHRLEHSKRGGSTHSQPSGNFFTRLLSRDLSESDQQEANGIAAMNQFGRLNQELDSAIARLAHKTDTLLMQLAKLDDHLQSIKQLIIREQYRLNPHASDDTNQMDSVWTTLSGFIHGPGDSNLMEPNEKESKVLNELERIASYHDLMTDVIGKLDRELKALQKIRAIRA